MLMEAHRRLGSTWHYYEGGAPIRIHTANRDEATLGREMIGAGPQPWMPMTPAVEEKRYTEGEGWITVQWGLPQSNTLSL